MTNDQANPIKQFSIPRGLILIVVFFVLVIGLIFLPKLLSERLEAPTYALDDSIGGTYTIGCFTDGCIVSDIKPDGAITSFRITGPLSYRDLRLNYVGCVSKENFTFVTYEITNKGTGFFGGRIAQIGTPYCIEIDATD